MRWLAALALAAAGCVPQAPPSLRPAPLPTAHRIEIAITPYCDWGTYSEWHFVPPVGVVPDVAWYLAIDTKGGERRAVQLAAGTQGTVVLSNPPGPWQLFMLSSDNTWVPVSGIVVNPPGRCV